MISVKVKAAVAVGSASAVVLAGAAVASAHPGPAAPRPAATYKITKSGSVTGAKTLNPGRVKINVAGRHGSLQLATAKHGAKVKRLVADVNKVNSQPANPVPLEHDFVLLGGAAPGSTVWVTLKRGVYYFANPSGKFSASKVLKVVVKGRLQNAAAPKSHTLTAIHSMTWATNPRGIPHKGNVRLANKATQPHFIVLVKIKKGKTFADVKKALMGKEPIAKVLDFSNEFDSAVVSSGHSAVMNYSLAKGRYALTCFWPAHNGTPHAFMGMVREINLH